MITLGKLLSENPVSSAADEEPTQETRMFKVSKYPAVLMHASDQKA